MPIEKDLSLNSPRVALLIEYDGRSFLGSQFQRQNQHILPTIQQSVEEALTSLQIPVTSVHFAGRTDTGVHARGQVAHFDLLHPEGLQNIPSLSTALNAVLPETISVKKVKVGVPKTFHAQYKATHRWYRYTLFNRSERSSMCQPDASWIRSPLDWSLMHQAAQQLLGTHHFKNVRCIDSVSHHDDICRVDYAAVQKEGDYISFDIVANRFLYKMVRNLTGLLLAIGHHELPYTSSVVLEAIAQEERARATWLTTKPGGLTLMAVLYPEPFSFFEDDEYIQTLQHLLAMESHYYENLHCKAS